MFRFSHHLHSRQMTFLFLFTCAILFFSLKEIFSLTSYFAYYEPKIRIGFEKVSEN